MGLIIIAVQTSVNSAEGLFLNLKLHMPAESPELSVSLKSEEAEESKETRLKVRNTDKILSEINGLDWSNLECVAVRWSEMKSVGVSWIMKEGDEVR